MGLKKYEIITVGSDKRVRALRSWQVGDRYVNIGDVGGIVYDEKTLSQEGACWLFRGNFGFPGARIGGDSIVDVGEATLSTAGAPSVDILGSSVVVGGKLRFASEQTAADAVVLTAADFEQGGFNAPIVGNPLTGSDSPNYIRTKALIFTGGAAVTLKVDVPGYVVRAFRLNADLVIIGATTNAATGAGVTLVVPAAQYFMLTLTKNPAEATVPADATAAKITFTGTYETKLSIVDSRVEINPANATGTATIRPGGVHTIASGVKYPESIIRNSKVVINGHATANRIIRLMSEFIGCNVAIDATSDNAQSVGIYSNVKNLTFTGAVSSDSLNVNVPSGIQATDCDNFAVSPTIFPGLVSARPINKPFIFQGCNVPDGRFYHHAQIANTYKNIDFAKAQADLGKSIASDGILASSEVEGMYRIYWSYFGALVESYDSVKSLNISTSLANSYGTTIYKDAYISGNFDIAGTNVFGNTKKHDTQDVSGCKIVNTGETAVNMKGNIRVEGNATLTNCSIIGSGYFGGKAVASGLLIEGSVFMSDNAVFAPSSLKGACTLVHMEGNAKFIGSVATSSTNFSFRMRDNAVIEGRTNTHSGVVMSGNSKVTATGQITAACRGVLVMTENASIEADTTVIGAITLAGNYKGNVVKTWIGKRTITDVNEPEYDNNVKSKYDL